MTQNLFRQRPEDSSAHFFLIFVALGLLSVGMILLLAGYGLKRTIHQQVYNEAENDAVQISMAILRLEADALLREISPGLWHLGIDQEGMAEFDARMQRLLTIFAIDKVKIFDKNQMVIYSTDPAIIGLPDRENPRLARALSGLVDSSLKRKETPVDLALEAGFGLDMVETYVPVFSEQGRVIGVIEVYKDVTRYRETLLVLIWKNISMLVAVLLVVFIPSLLVVKALTRRLSAVQAQLKEQASIDALTGVLSRREIMTRAGSAGSDPRQRPATPHRTNTNGIMMLDIDNFKDINDSHGHLVGDMVIRAVAQRLATGLRRETLVGRYGGEEFLLVLPDSSLETTRALGERIRKIIADAPFACEGRRLAVTVSIGLSCCARGDEQAFLLALEDADQGLYLAKCSGRNQVRSGPRAAKDQKFRGLEAGVCPIGAEATAGMATMQKT